MFHAFMSAFTRFFASSLLLRREQCSVLRVVRSTFTVLVLMVFSVLGVGCGQQVESQMSPVSGEQTEQSQSKPAQELIVYSARKEHLIKPLFDLYEKETGVSIRYITDQAGALLARLQAEGARTPADILLTVDAGNLWHAAESGLLKALDSPVLKQNIPVNLRDAEGRWFGLSLRARTIVYSTQRVSRDELSTYADLALPAFQGRLCLRTSKKVYNQSLVASLIDRLGPEKTQAIVAGWVSNLATDVFSSDTQLIEAIAAGACDVGVVNTYYLGRLQRDHENYPVAIFWPNQEGSGVHVNVSGAGVTKHSQHPEAAQKLLEWLSSPAIQAQFSAINLEFPVNPSVPVDPLIASWGPFKSDDLHVEKLGELQSEAIKLMDRVGYR